MILKGKCHSNFEERVSAKGTTYGTFHVQGGGKIWQILIFGKKVEYAKQHVRIDEKVIVDGKQGSDQEDPVITAWSVEFPAIQKERTWNLSDYTKSYREYVEYQKTLGFVEWRDEEGRSNLIKRRYCILVGTKWIPAIEFAMDVYGGETVKAMLREMGVLDWALKDWKKKRESIEAITESAIIKYRDDNPGGVSIVKGWEKEQIPGSENASRRDLVPLESGGVQIHGATDIGASGENRGAGTTEIF